MPDYTVIAGPNGAGKSTYSAAFSSHDAIMFDADIVKAIREKQYPDVPYESIEMMLTSAYWEAEDSAIEQKKDLTVETNLRDDFLIKRALSIKDKGFTTNLIYMLLPDINMSLDRVTLRVAQKGHFVDLESIKYNFEQGLIILKEHFHSFDNLTILNSALKNDLFFPERLLILNNSNISYMDLNPPAWAKPIIDEIVQKL